MPPRKNNQSNLKMFIWILCIISLALIIYFVYTHCVTSKENESSKICLSISQFQKLQQTPNTQTETQQNNTQPDRDRRVLSDPLYPPLNRTDAVTHGNLETNMQQRNMYVATNSLNDKYRVVGYLVSNDPHSMDKGGNNWKLMARQKDRNNADFYMIPANNNYDIKINISNEMVQGPEKLKDLYTIPSKITLNSPMLNTTPYDFVEIPKADLSSSDGYI